MGAILEVWPKIENINSIIHESIYLKKNPAKFHRDPIWNDGALGFFRRGHLNKNNNNNRMSGDMGSVPDWKNIAVSD